MSLHFPCMKQHFICTTTGICCPILDVLIIYPLSEGILFNLSLFHALLCKLLYVTVYISIK